MTSAVSPPGSRGFRAGIPRLVIVLLTLTLLFALSLLALALLLSNYLALILLAAGLVCGLILSMLLVETPFRRLLTLARRLLLFLTLILLLASVGLLILNPPIIPYTPTCVGSAYRVVLLPLDDSLSSFLATEELALGYTSTYAVGSSASSATPSVLNEILAHLRGYLAPPETWIPSASAEYVYTLPARRLVSAHQGLLLNEVVIYPEAATLAQAITPEGEIAFSPCVQGSLDAEVRNLPLNSFFAARDAYDVQLSQYLDTESVRWSTADNAIAFSFLRAPFSHFRVLLAPFINISSTRRWLLPLIGLALAGLLVPALRSLLADSYPPLLRRIFPNRPKETASLIVSPDGQERQIRVKRPPHDSS